MYSLSYSRFAESRANPTPRCYSNCHGTPSEFKNPHAGLLDKLKLHFDISRMDEMTPTLASLTDVYKALGHPARLRVLEMLRGGELCVCQITATLNLASSTVSAHLAALRRADLVAERKEGRWIYYRLDEGKAAHDFLETVWRELENDPLVSADARIVHRLRAIPVAELCRVDLQLQKLGITRATSPGA